MAKMRDLKLQLGPIAAVVEMHKANNDRTRISFKTMHKHKNGTLGEAGKRDYCKDPNCQGHAGIDDKAEIVKGYAIAKGSYIEVNEDDIDKLRVDEDGLVHCTEIVDAQDLFKRPYVMAGGFYHLIPERKAKYPDESYSLIHQYLLGGKVAIAKTCLNDRTQAVAIMAHPDGCILMYMLRYPSEIRDIPRVELAPTTASYLQLLEQVAAPLAVPEPSMNHVDDFEAAKEQYIQMRSAGVAIPERKPATATVANPNIEALLKAALAAQGGKTEEKPKAKAKGKKGRAA